MTSRRRCNSPPSSLTADNTDVRLVGGVLVAALLLASRPMPAAANAIAGGGYSSSYSGESTFTSVDVGGTGQFSAIFFNSGTQIWAPGVVGLLVCAPDKVTCNVPNNSLFNKSWYSSTVYATVASFIQPGQNGFFTYNFTVPTGTPGGTTTSFYGDVGLISTGAVLRPEGYFQSNTTPQPSLSLTLSPASASMGVGGLQQFTVSGQPVGLPITWSVTGGCGAITQAGLFAATAMNSFTQPCSVVASGTGWRGSSPITVYGTVSQLSCSVTPSSIVANGVSTATATVALKDQNGNLVANANAPQVTLINVTPTLATMGPLGVAVPANGVVNVTVTSTTAPGDIQLSASAVGYPGCNVIVHSTSPGNASKTVASLSTGPIAADGLSTSTVQVDITDASGNRILSDNITQIGVTVGGVNSCHLQSIVTGSNPNVSSTFASAVVAQGRAAFLLISTTTPGQCTFAVTTNNSNIVGTSVSLTTRTVGAAASLTVLSNDSPHVASNGGVCDLAGTPTDPSCTRVVIGVQDASGFLVTGDVGRLVNLAFSGCSGAGGDVQQRGSTTTTQGKATFVFASAGAYTGCVISFSSANLTGTTTTAVWTPGSPDHLTCTLNPNSVPSNSSPIVTLSVNVRDVLGNVVPTGTYYVAAARTVGNASALLNPGAQYTQGGVAVFTVQRVGTNVGVDVYTPSVAAGSLSHVVADVTCMLVLQ